MLTGEIQVTKSYNKGRVKGPEETTEEMITLTHFTADKPTGSVSSGARMTINLGNYESVQLSVHVTLPMYIEELEDAYEATQKFVNEKMELLISDVKDKK